jgi:hypothetical protein
MGTRKASDTSGARLRRAPRAPGPLIAASKKLANRLLVSREKSRNFCRRTNPWLPSPGARLPSWVKPAGAVETSTYRRRVAASVNTAAIP